MNLIEIEEPWTAPDVTVTLKRLLVGDRDESLLFNELGDNLARLEDIGKARIAAMKEHSAKGSAPSTRDALRHRAVAQVRASETRQARGTFRGPVKGML